MPIPYLPVAETVVSSVEEAEGVMSREIGREIFVCVSHLVNFL